LVRTRVNLEVLKPAQAAQATLLSNTTGSTGSGSGSDGQPGSSVRVNRAEQSAAIRFISYLPAFVGWKKTTASVRE
jgi:hypothetical protein